VTPHYADESVTLYHGDCLDVLRELPDASVDAVVTDPPYELGFMGRRWDASGIAYNVELWKQCLRVLKPGGHLLAFGGTRTWHRLTCAIEDAGFEIRDTLAWLYGSGFPKSLDVGKAIDKAAGAEREVVGERFDGSAGSGSGVLNMNGRDLANGSARSTRTVQITAPATDEPKRWDGWGTALKPAHEPIIVARKPLAGTVAQNVLAHGTGALNIDATRVGTGGHLKWAAPRGMGFQRDVDYSTDSGRQSGANSADVGRWPANVVLDETAAAELDRQSGYSTSPASVTGGANRTGDSGPAALGRQDDVPCYGDSGGASRFFPTFRYEAKADTGERPRVGGVAHPTVKPLDLMRWLVRLVTPPGGLVLDPFAGSGTTAEACVVEGFRCVAVEREPTYLPLIVARLVKELQPVLAGLEVG
jgi:site-specific DNA-methyltransferase (adenine-specific)